MDAAEVGDLAGGVGVAVEVGGQQGDGVCAGVEGVVGGTDGVGQGDAAGAGDDAEVAAEGVALGDDGLDDLASFVEADGGALAVSAEREDGVDALLLQPGEVGGDPVQVERGAAGGEGGHLGDHQAGQLERHGGLLFRIACGLRGSDCALGGERFEVLVAEAEGAVDVGVVLA